MKDETTKIAIVLGSMGYVGRAVVEEFDAKGVQVALVYFSTNMDEVLSFIASLKHSHHKAYHCDISQSGNFANLIHTIESEMGKPTFAIDASGIPPVRKQIADCSFSEVEEYMAKSFQISFIFLTECAKFFKKEKSGILIGITTVGVIKSEATKMLGSYVIAKYATQGLLTLLRGELSQFGISVFSVAPGFMANGLNKNFPKAFIDIFKTKYNISEITTAKDVAIVISGLCLQNPQDDTLTIPVANEYPSL